MQAFEKNCTDHKQVFIGYCKKCKLAFCNDCGKHDEGHSIISLKHILIPAELKAYINQLTEITSIINDSLERIPLIKDDLLSKNPNTETISKSINIKLAKLSNVIEEYQELKKEISKVKKMLTKIQSRVSKIKASINLYSGFEEYSDLVLPDFIENCKTNLNELDDQINSILEMEETNTCYDGRIGKIGLDCGHNLCIKCTLKKRTGQGEVQCIECGGINRNIGKNIYKIEYVIMNCGCKVLSNCIKAPMFDFDTNSKFVYKDSHKKSSLR